MLLRKLLTQSVLAAAMLINLSFSNLTPVFATGEDVPANPITSVQQPRARVFLPLVSTTPEIINSQATDKLDGDLQSETLDSEATAEETEVLLSTNEEISAALLEVGYSDKQVQAIFEMHNRLGEAYQNGASEEELLAIAAEYDPILQDSPQLVGRNLTATTAIASWQWILRWLERGATARYSVKFGPYVSTFYYVVFNPKVQLQTHWKFGFCFKIFGGRCTVHHTSWAPGFYTAHTAFGNSVSSHTWWPN